MVRIQSFDDWSTGERNKVGYVNAASSKLAIHLAFGRNGSIMALSHELVHVYQLLTGGCKFPIVMEGMASYFVNDESPELPTTISLDHLLHDVNIWTRRVVSRFEYCSHSAQ